VKIGYTVFTQVDGSEASYDFEISSRVWKKMSEKQRQDYILDEAILNGLLDYKYEELGKDW
jgi:hypothetical protein